MRNAEHDFASRAAMVATPLRESLLRLNESAELDEILRNSIHPSIRSRVTQAMATENALASLYRMPGPDGLRRVLRAAERTGSDPTLLAECEASIEAYERIFAVEEISQQTLHAMLADYLPEAREQVLRTSRQSMYKATSILMGYQINAAVLSLFIFPGSRPDRCHVAVVRGNCGWRRLRQDCMFAAHGYSVRSSCDDDAQPHTDLDGAPLSELETAPLLERFCSRPLPRFNRVAIPGGCNYYLDSDDLGVHSTCTFFVAEVLANSQFRYRSSESAIAIESVIFGTPSKRAIFDLFIHKDVWPSAAPTVEVFNTVPRGPVDESNYGYRQNDRIEMGAELRALKSGAVETAAVRNYGGLTRHVFEKLNFSETEFRGYRCEVAYPMFGSQAVLSIPLQPQ